MRRIGDKAYWRDGHYYALTKAGSGSYCLTPLEAWEMGQCESDSPVLCISYVLDKAKTESDAEKDLERKGFKEKNREDIPF